MYNNFAGESSKSCALNLDVAKTAKNITEMILLMNAAFIEFNFALNLCKIL